MPISRIVYGSDASQLDPVDPPVDPPDDPTLATTTNETSVTQYGITWYFDQAYPVGTFVNGDYFVVGPVTVTSVDPAPAVLPYGETSTKSVNGSMINPTIGVQAYDSRTYMWTPELGVSFPTVLDADESLVSTISDERDGLNMQLLTAAVLTCVSTTPSATAFRPTYMGTDKRLYDYSNANTALLPSLAITGDFPSTATIAESWERSIQRPWLLHGRDWFYGRIFPSLNGHWYHQNQIQTLAGVGAMLVCDWEDKETLLIRYLQLALDYFSLHYQPGTEGPYYWRWPIIFAGLILGESAMRDMFVDKTYTTPPYHSDENGRLYFGDDPRINRTRISEIIPWGETWTYYETNTGNSAVFYGGMDDGNQGHRESLHPDEWYWLEEAGGISGGKLETYRLQHSAGLVGQTLAALAMNADNYFGQSAFVAYTDRWMHETAEYLISCGSSGDSAHDPQTSNIDWLDSMWFAHRSSL